MGISELIIILVIVLIIFGAGRLPQLGEGLGKALKGFKKEVNEIPPMVESGVESSSNQPAQLQAAPPPQTIAPIPTATPAAAAAVPAGAASGAIQLAAYRPGPEATPGTTAALMAAGAPPQPAKTGTPQIIPPRFAPQPATQGGMAPAPLGTTPAPLSMEQRMAQPAPMVRAAYPPLPPTAQAKPVVARASSVVNKDAVARVQAQQAALRAKATQAPPPADMQSLGEGLGDALRTFRQAVADVRGAVDPEMRTIQAEMDAAQKEIQQTIENAKQMPTPHQDPPAQSA
jgi:TatA/E family protein of Tat protein translocase